MTKIGPRTDEKEDFSADLLAASVFHVPILLPFLQILPVCSVGSSLGKVLGFVRLFLKFFLLPVL